MLVQLKQILHDSAVSQVLNLRHLRPKMQQSNDTTSLTYIMAEMLPKDLVRRKGRINYKALTARLQAAQVQSAAGGGRGMPTAEEAQAQAEQRK